jgi:hypothetical protein
VCYLPSSSSDLKGLHGGKCYVKFYPLKRRVKNFMNHTVYWEPTDQSDIKKKCPPLTEPNAVFCFQNRPFLDPFLNWSTQPTFKHPIAILPSWYLWSSLFHSRVTLQLWLHFSTPLCVREVGIILRPFGKYQIPNSRCVMKIKIKFMNMFLDGSTPYSLW